MNVKGATKEQLEFAASRNGVKLYNLREVGSQRKGPQLAFQLKTNSEFGGKVQANGPTGKPGWRARYARFGRRFYGDNPNGNRIVPGAVCWHGHRDFFRALFALVPEATIKTALAVYLGGAHFEQSYLQTKIEGGERMGMRLEPDAQECVCANTGEVEW